MANKSINNIVIGNRAVGLGQPTFIIAEAGVNHNGDLKLAKRLVEEAKKCGADCVKFQYWKTERLLIKNAPKAAYQLKTTKAVESQYEMLSKLELSDDEHRELHAFCKKEGIIYLSSFCNIEDVSFLDSLAVPAYKIASPYVIETLLLEYVAPKRKPILLSTGMCDLKEVEEALKVVRKAGNSQIVVLQCTTNYPSALEDANLRAMQTMAQTFDILVGYSDHTNSLIAAPMAVALGACVIEKHFTLNKNLPGPDHSSSCDPGEFSQLVRNIREAEKCLGVAEKKPSLLELQNAKYMRRSIVAKKLIQKGEVLSLDNITFKRPADGISPKRLKNILGRRATKKALPDTVISLGMIQ